jgi:hypothetical protein
MSEPTHPFFGDAEVSQNRVKHSPENNCVPQGLVVPSLEAKSFGTPVEMLLPHGDE